MVDETTTTATGADSATAPAADSSLIDNAVETASDALDVALAESKSFLSKAQETLANAAGSAMNTVKEHPIAAAGIAAGAAAAVAGAAYGASKLFAGDASDDDGSTKG
ncbi:MAG: hypothetical protein ACTHJR_01445 [Sphingomonas sp.]|uniref:hypothetical protein n=1 Tax=Sphingomonas sp. TaxID=28214 RepID=UPI003F81C7FA